jgi:hypothetical protein
MPQGGSTVQHTVELQPIAVGVKDAAKLIGVSQRSIRNYIQTGQLATARVQGRVLVPLDVLRAFIQSRTVKVS